MYTWVYDYKVDSCLTLLTYNQLNMFCFAQI